mmetsp:Transcript_6054/g.10768  ORF Transcript_6054/g.10768 Transcript_6054/m.10768 type:complete len:292 (-) Transcript_6054:1177-2052(-)
MWSSNNRSISEDASWVTTNSLKQQQLLQNTSTLNNSLSTPTLTSATPPTQSLNDAVYVNIIDDEDDNVNTSTSQSMHQSNPKVQVSHQPLRSTPSSARVGGALRKINSSTGSLNQPNGKLHSTFSSTHLSASQSPRLTPRHIASTHSGTHTPTVHANQYLNGGTNFDMSAIPTEFVFRDAHPDAVHVNLCGDWNEWKKKYILSDLINYCFKLILTGCLNASTGRYLASLFPVSESSVHSDETLTRAIIISFIHFSDNVLPTQRRDPNPNDNTSIHPASSQRETLNVFASCP